MGINIRRTAAALTLILVAASLPAKTIKLGSLAPVGTPWDNALKQMAAEWASISGGKIKLKIYPGGIAGDEPDMLRKMRLGQLQAAGITSISLWSTAPGLLALHVPLFMRTSEELTWVLEKIRPEVEKQLEAKGYKVLIWSIVGWTHFYTRKPVVTPEDLMKQRLFVWEGDPDEIQTWKEMGFNPVPLAATDVMSSLQNGMIDGIATTSLNAASNQWFGIAKNMCGMQWAPLLGAIVVSSKVWKKIPAGLQPQLYESARKIGAEMQKNVFKTEQDAVAIMKQNGLVINEVPAETETAWKKVVAGGFDSFAGKGYDKSWFTRVEGLLQEYRSGK